VLKMVLRKDEYEVLPSLTITRHTIPLIRRIARLTEKGKARYIIRLPLELNHLWEPLYRSRKHIIVHIEVR